MFKKSLVFIVFVSLIVVLAGCKNPTVPDPPDEPVNSAPNPLVKPDSNITVYAGTGSFQTFQLECSDNIDSAFLYDVDGDSVTVIVDSTTPLPLYISLNASTGLVSIDTDGAIPDEGENIILNFWTIDDKGGSTETSLLVVTIDIAVS